MFNLLKFDDYCYRINMDKLHKKSSRENSRYGILHISDVTDVIAKKGAKYVWKSKWWNGPGRIHDGKRNEKIFKRNKYREKDSSLETSASYERYCPEQDEQFIFVDRGKGRNQ